MWKDFNVDKPPNGSKCLVVFENVCDGEKSRWLSVDLYEDDNFTFLVNFEDVCSNAGLPEGSMTDKVKAVLWQITDIDPYVLNVE